MNITIKLRVWSQNINLKKIINHHFICMDGHFESSKNTVNRKSLVASFIGPLKFDLNKQKALEKLTLFTNNLLD